MAFSKVKEMDRATTSKYVEIVLDSASDISNVPTSYASGSVAYTADLSYVYILSPTNGWVAVS